MIQESIALKESGTKIAYVRRHGATALISDGKNANGKWHIIDMCIGNISEAMQDLRAEGYTIKSF